MVAQSVKTRVPGTLLQKPREGGISRNEEGFHKHPEAEEGLSPADTARSMEVGGWRARLLGPRQVTLCHNVAMLGTEPGI